MALTSDSLTKRSIGPAVGSAVVGVALGVVAVVGVAQFSGATPVESVPASDAVLGGPEYGSRR